MASFFLKKDEYACLSRLYAGADQINEADRELLEKSDVLIHNDAGEKILNQKVLFILETCMAYDAYMSVRKISEGEQEDYCYFLRDDCIVRMEQKKEGYVFLSLPTIKYAIGSVADLIWNFVSDVKEVSYEAFLNEELNQENYVEMLNDLIAEKEYQIDASDNEVEFIFNGVGERQKIDFFMAVRCRDGKARYYSQEFGSVAYGMAGKAELTNKISHWMLYKHRELIQNILGEE